MSLLRRPHLAIPVALALGLAPPALAGSRNDDQDARIAALEAEVASLKAQLATLMKERTTAAPPPSESELMDLFRAASDAREQGDVEEAKALLKQIADGAPGTRIADAATRSLTELNVVGMDFPGLDDVTWLQGDAPDLSADAATVVVFWEVWCPHCKREVPNLQATLDAWVDRGLGVVGVTKLSRGKTADDVLAFAEEQGVTFPLAQEDGGLSDALSVRGVPAAAVVQDGTVVWRGHPATITEAMLERWTTAE